jgi:hypothetical protein
VSGARGEAHGGVVPGSPSDNTTLQDVLQAFRDEGWDGDAHAVEGGMVRWGSCRHEVPADGVRPDRTRRMEGASDPADMLAVVAVTCPRCGERAVLVLHYGPTASSADADVLVALPM